MASASESADRPPRLSDFSALGVSAPRAVGECTSCGRCLVRARMCVVAVGAADLCGLCGHIATVASAVATSPISAYDEEEAMALLAKVYALLQRQRDWARGGHRCGPYMAEVVGTTSAEEQVLPVLDVLRPSS